MNHTCLYCPAAERHRTLAGTHFPSRSGQKAELARVAGYKPRWFTRPQTTYPSANRDRRRVTSLAWHYYFTPNAKQATSTYSTVMRSEYLST